MRCEAHPSEDAVGTCKTCGRGVCVVCKVVFDGIIHCRACVEAGRITRHHLPAPVAAAMPAYPPPPSQFPQLQPPQRGPELGSGTRTMLYLMSVIPVLGLIIGLVYASGSDRDSRTVGGNCLIIGLVSTVLGCLCWVFGGWGLFYL